MSEFCEVEYKKPTEDEVVVKTMFSTISCGTEKANITDAPNLSGEGVKRGWPRELGYSSSGVVVEIGEKVTNVSVGDRVVVYWGCHKKYNTVPQKLVVKITDDSISFEDAAVSFIATFPLAAIRKTRFEIGESAIVMGQGILGQLAVKLLRVAGAMPIIAVDPVASRREEAIKNGADFALDPN